MSNFHVALKTKLEQDPAVKKLIDTRIFPNAAPQNAPKPYVVYEVAVETSLQCLDGPTSAGQSTIRFNCIDDNPNRARLLKELVRLQLDGKQFSIDDIDIQHCIEQQTTDEPEIDADAGEFLAYKLVLEFNVFHSRQKPPGNGGTGSGGNTGGGTGNNGGSNGGNGGGNNGGGTPTVTYPAMPSADASLRYHYAEIGWEVGSKGDKTLATALPWKGNPVFGWYGYTGDGTVSDPLTGLPNGRTILQGHIDRLKANIPGAMFGYYTTLVRVATAAAHNTRGIWPYASAVLTDAYLEAWLNPSYNTPGDAYAGEYGIAYKDATCRGVHSTAYADFVERIYGFHRPELVFSDNFAHPSIASFVDWPALMDLTKQVFTKLAARGVPFMPVPNCTNHYWGDQRADLDLAADAGIAGFKHEGLMAQHVAKSSEFANIIRNLQHWLAKPWIGGGRRGIFAHANSDPAIDKGFNRRVTIASVTDVAGKIRVTCTAPHYLSNTSVWKLRLFEVHTDYNGLELTHGIITPVSDTAFDIALPTKGTYSLTATSHVQFQESGKDVDAAILLSIRKAGDASFAHQHIATRPDPWWETDFATYGAPTGAPEVVSTHSVPVYSNAGVLLENRTCVKRFKTPFGQGPSDKRWLYVDLSEAERRAWRAAS